MKTLHCALVQYLSKTQKSLDTQRVSNFLQVLRETNRAIENLTCDAEQLLKTRQSTIDFVEEVIQSIRETKDWTSSVRKKANIASITGLAASVVAVCAAPFTGGVSMVALPVGLAVGFGGGVANYSAKHTKSESEERRKNMVLNALKEEEKTFETFRSYIKGTEPKLENVLKEICRLANEPFHENFDDKTWFDKNLTKYFGGCLLAIGCLTGVPESVDILMQFLNVVEGSIVPLQQLARVTALPIALAGIGLNIFELYNLHQENQQPSKLADDLEEKILIPLKDGKNKLREVIDGIEKW